MRVLQDEESYSQAVEDDGRSVSRYGDRTIGEDFAEFYKAHRNAEQQGARGLADRQARYPERFGTHRSVAAPTQIHRQL